MPRYLTDSLPGRHGWPIALAHRGADPDRENTLAAFSAAVDRGFGYLELDVRTTADGVPVVFHDETLERITTGAGPLAERTWDELAQFRVVGEHPDGSPGEPLLLFEDLLSAFPHIHLNVDLKDAASAEAVATVVHRHDAWARVLVASFVDAHRIAYRDHARRLTGRDDLPIAHSGGTRAVATLVFTHRFPLPVFRKVVERLRRDVDLHAVQVPVRSGPIPVVTARFVERCHQVGLAVHVWVVDDPAEMERLLALGVDGLVTDNGAGLAEVMAARGHWPQR
ncbi:glycerophosphodiester phosphodiesterase family protein [Citricoccus muralis]|uniref:Glycerophosphodiester phosphodiesterase family protein n=1 Tax=Citricoccus muralis TaxID=169134 RepID=A0ABY8H7N4_9MICC|nr:glycerophosphodiester phosphodiesterase family protein [Citricoccus muralis]WFP16705.1 glycerophosphodiester phosphodiesterase family protein [Citricoccus muralis]